MQPSAWGKTHDNNRSSARSNRSRGSAARLTPDQLEAALREIGAARYHNLHPFHKLLHGGKLDKGQVQAPALNHYYYQAIIPRKDTALMSKMTDGNAARMAAALFRS